MVVRNRTDGVESFNESVVHNQVLNIMVYNNRRGAASLKK